MISYWKELIEKASKAGRELAAQVEPVKWGFCEADIFGNKIGKTHYYPPCGFAWVKIYADGRSAFGKFLRDYKGEAGRIHKSYYGKGYELWCPLSTQSVEIKEAWANGFVDYIKAHDPDIKCFAVSRLD